MAALRDYADLSGLELVHLLLRRIVRGFYSTKYSIVLDIILKHSAIRDDYLSQMMGLQNQEVRKLCGRLREDRILTIHTRQEPKPGQTRMISRTYYFIENRDAVDAIKYRIHRLVRVIEEQSKNDFESKGYVCPYCQRRYGALDVLPLVSHDGQNFECADCRTVLADDEESMESKVSQERLARLQKQTQLLVSTLKQIDSSFVPDNDFTSALASAIPPNLEHLNVNAQATSLLGMYDNSNTTRTTTAALDVRIDYNVGQQDSVEEKARKLEQAQKNALPEWHLQSTVSGEVIAGRANGTTVLPDDDTKEVQLDAAATDQVAEYYKALRAQQLVRDSASDGDEEEEDEEQEKDFDDASELPTSPKIGSSVPAEEEESEDEFEDID